jgi:hypothetical protein
MRGWTMRIARGLMFLVIAASRTGNCEAAWIFWSGEHQINRSCMNGLNSRTVATTVPSSADVYGIAVDEIGSKMYWTQRSGTGSVVRADLNGENVEVFSTAQYMLPFGIAVDSIHRYVFWMDGSFRRIYRGHLDSGVVETVVSQLNYTYGGIAVHPADEKIYWVDPNNIRRANLDGTNVETILSQGAFPGFSPRQLAIDFDDGQLYWTNGLTQIWRSNLDGTNPQQVLSGLNSALSIAVDSPADKVYWSSGGNQIRRSNTSGTGVETVLTWPSLGSLALHATPCAGGDCQPNGIPDECDLCSGSGNDCNANDRPDECDISDLSTDCNRNTIPDECDIDAGVSFDCNYNFLPDECEVNVYCANQGSHAWRRRYSPIQLRSPITSAVPWI